MNVGTKSILFGVHQFLWHPLTVGLAWFALYGKWPKWHEWVAIFCHDLGYWGCPNMDGEEGQRHPVRGADLTANIVLRISLALLSLRHPIRYWNRTLMFDDWVGSFELAAGTRRLALGHSRFYAKKYGVPISPLFKADKASIYFDPKFFYLFRARASGEILEYMVNARGLPASATTSDWFDWYQRKVGELL